MLSLPSRFKKIIKKIYDLKKKTKNKKQKKKTDEPITV
jgi:hypothetical protein